MKRIFPEKNHSLSLSLSLQKSRIATAIINATLDKDRANRPVYRINYSWAKVTTAFSRKDTIFLVTRCLPSFAQRFQFEITGIIKETIIAYINPILPSLFPPISTGGSSPAWNPAGINRRIKERNCAHSREQYNPSGADPRMFAIGRGPPSLPCVTKDPTLVREGGSGSKWLQTFHRIWRGPAGNEPRRPVRNKG